MKMKEGTPDWKEKDVTSAKKQREEKVTLKNGY